MNNQIISRLYKNRLFVYFYNKRASSFSIYTLWENIQNKFIKPLPTNSKLLELGTGPASLTIKLIKKYKNIKIIASDFSTQMIDKAKENLAKENLENSSNIEFLQLNANDLSDFDKNSFDGIYSIGTIKHLKDGGKCLNECVNLLKKDGYFYFSDFTNFASLQDCLLLTKSLRVNFFMRFILAPIIFIGTKKEGVSEKEILKWADKLKQIGDVQTDFSSGKVIFEIVFKKT